MREEKRKRVSRNRGEQINEIINEEEKPMRAVNKSHRKRIERYKRSYEVHSGGVDILDEESMKAEETLAINIITLQLK